MDLLPGQLVLTKTEFEGHEIPIDWSEERLRPLGDRKTIRHVRIKKNEILFITSALQEDVFFLNHERIKRQIVTF